MAFEMRRLRSVAIALSIIAVGVFSWLTPWAAQAQDTSYDRRTYFSQPMGYSIWKRPPQSVEEFAKLVESNRLNATSQQYAESLHDAGWIPNADVAAAVAFIRTLKEGEAKETKRYRMGRILRSYKAGQGDLDASFVQVMKVGERGYFDGTGRLVIRVLCLNVVYPDRHVAVLPSSEERPQIVPVAPQASAPLVESRPPEPLLVPPPPPEKPEPVSRSLP